MQVATFNETNAPVGTTITRECDFFILEDHGPITAVGVMEYDRQGHHLWANDDSRNAGQFIHYRQDKQLPDKRFIT